MVNDRFNIARGQRDNGERNMRDNAMTARRLVATRVIRTRYTCRQCVTTRAKQYAKQCVRHRANDT
jgi:hypothetical protein